MKRNRNWKTTHTLLEKRTLCFSSYKNHKLKVNCDELELEKEKTGFFVALILSEGNFFEICILSQCIVY